MTDFNFDDYKAGKYAPESFYGRLGELEKHEPTKYDSRLLVTYEWWIWDAEHRVVKEIIAGVEARVGELSNNLTDGLPEDSEEAYDMGVEDGEIRALTILLEGEKHG